MTPPGALALTAALLAFAALMTAAVADITRSGKPYGRIAWVLFAAGIVGASAAGWWEALS